MRIIFLNICFVLAFTLYGISVIAKASETRIVIEYSPSDAMIRSALDFHGIDEELVYLENNVLYFSRDGKQCKLITSSFLQQQCNNEIFGSTKVYHAD